LGLTLAVLLVGILAVVLVGILAVLLVGILGGFVTLSHYHIVTIRGCDVHG
jgi:hypothetical protein